MTSTFADLGIPFPLFDAPVREACDYVGHGSCSLCGLQQVCCFRLGVGSDVIVPCAACDEANALSADERVGQPCRTCGSPVAFPPLTGHPLLVCYDCLRAGNVAFTQDTILGMVRWEDAIQGITFGCPSLTHPDFELVPHQHGWVGARVPVPTLLELVRTPTYSTIQGERWLFCCRQPMVYIGRWTREDFERHAPDGDGRVLFNGMVLAGSVLPDVLWNGKGEVWDAYIFRCAVCQRLFGHWDVA